MYSMKEIYGDVEFGNRTVKATDSRSFGLESFSSERVLAKAESSLVKKQDFDIQRNIRGLFGKPGVKHPPIGGHPDFDHLKDTGSLEFGFTTTLFMDIKGSTKLGVMYSPEQVFIIKNKIIKCAIETIQAFDGHVHRIMGDAVLAFFRSDGKNARNSAIDAINCGAYLVQFVRELVNPALQRDGLNEDVGVRVGVDYGPSESVLWGMYGYAGVSEVTATSFHVDVAAKLQQNAPKNRVMLGQSLCELLDLHEEVVEIKRVTQEGEKVTERFISPNYKNAEGMPINYQQFVLSQDRYLSLLPKPGDNRKPIIIFATLKAKAGNQSENYYHACSRAVERPDGIDFKALFKLPIQSNAVKVKFRVENHGKQASAIGGNGDHETLVSATQRADGQYFASQWESTSYVGLHYMYVSVLCDGRVVFPEQLYGVFVG